MRVALDVTARITGATGVARYAASLDDALVARGVQTSRFAIGRAVFPVPPSTRHIAIPLRVVHRCWALAQVPRGEWLAPKADLTHTLDLVVAPTRRPAVATVHDLDAILHPSMHDPRQVSTQHAQLESLRRAAVVLVTTRSMVETLAEHGVDDTKVVVTPYGCAPLPSAAPYVRPDGRPYVLSVGTVGTRKAHDVLVEAMTDPRLESIALVIAGPDGPGAPEVRAAASALGDRMHFDGPADDPRLAALYAGASAFVLASRAEGFGIPVIEAMAAGAPVVISAAPTIVEVAGDAATVVPIGDPTALADAIAAILSDGTLAARLRAAGPERAAAFTWDRCAALTIGAYERALGSR